MFLEKELLNRHIAENLEKASRNQSISTFMCVRPNVIVGQKANVYNV